MGKTIEELFKTKQLVDGKTAAEKYEIRNSKDMPLRSSTGAMDLPFKAVQIARRNLSSRTRETRLEQEVTGLRIISKLGGPIIYGTDIFKLSTQKTEMVSTMKDSVNPNNSADSGLLGNLFQKGKEKGLELLNKIGVQLPTKLIPTRISLNKDFKAGKEPDTMATLAKIKQDGAGNLAGKFLAQNAKGTPKQIGNQLLGGGIGLLKGEVKKKLFGAPKQGAQNLAKKGENEVQYDSSARYSDTVNPIDEDYLKRNDLSSILLARDANTTSVETPISSTAGSSTNSINASKNPFAKVGDKVGDIKKDNEKKLSQAKKVGQQEVSAGKSVGDTKSGAPATTADSVIKYSDTVDETSDDIALRNDLSTILSAKKENEAQNPDKKKEIDAAKTNTAPVNSSKNPFANLGQKIGDIKKESEQKLSQAKKVGQQEVSSGKKVGDTKSGGSTTTADSVIRYSDTVDETQDDVKLRNDLSTVLTSKKEKEKETPDKKKQIDAVKGNVGALNVKQNPFAKSEDKVKSADKDTKGELQSGRKLGQKSISDGTKKVGDLSEATSDVITYSSTVDETQDDVKLRNDLSTKLQALIKASSAVSSAGGISGLSRTDVQMNMYSSLKNKNTNKQKSKSLKTKYGIESSNKLDFLNEKTTYKSSGPLQLSDGTLLDDTDFITLKFKSIATGEAANFRATVTGISETVSPSWDTAKFIGSPFNHYTYSSIERSVSFNFKMYSTTPAQHIACWQRLNFLTGLAYPQGYSGPYALPPFVYLTLGSLYKNQPTYIDSLSYTMDDNAGWEIGSIDTPDKVMVNGKQVLIKDYKLPIVIDVSITLKLLESKSSTDDKKFYGFARLGANNSTQPLPGQETTTNAQKSGDANISSNATKVESSETLNQPNLKTLNNKEANKESEGNKSSIATSEKRDAGPKFDAFGNITNEGKFDRKKDTGPKFDAFGNITNEGKFTRKKSTGPEFDAFGNITNEGQF
jgi:hypothetical protein